MADKGAREVRKFNPEGQQLLTFTHPSWTADYSNSNVCYPECLTVDAEGNIYVIEAFRVLKFNAQAQLQWIYDPKQSGGSIRISSYKDVVADAKGNVFFLDYEYTITCLDASNGQKQRSFSVKRRHIQ